MALFLQNEANLFNAASSVEGALPFAHAHKWSLAKPGHRTLLFQNYADGYISPSQHDSTLQVLTRHGPSQPSWERCLPVSGATSWAKLSYYRPSKDFPGVAVVRWRSRPGCLTKGAHNHDWPRSPTVSFDATSLMVDFFLNTTPRWDAEIFPDTKVDQRSSILLV